MRLAAYARDSGCVHSLVRASTHALEQVGQQSPVFACSQSGEEPRARNRSQLRVSTSRDAPRNVSEICAASMERARACAKSPSVTRPWSSSAASLISELI
eukprot:6004661-Pleurochrysis_carterae.AAC.1